MDTDYPRRGRRGKLRHAFTLTELLIVVSIIALLTAIAMPTLGRARALARQSVCMANQRKIVAAVINYTTDNKYFPYNYADYYEDRPHGGYPATPDYTIDNTTDPPTDRQRWALGCINPYLSGELRSRTNLRGLDQKDFPKSYICPSADLREVFAANPDDKYHACYWTNPGVRLNQGWGTRLYTIGAANQGLKPGEDGSLEGISVNGPAIMRRQGACGIKDDGTPSNHWRSVYFPRLEDVPSPSGTVFSGDTTDSPKGHPYSDGIWMGPRDTDRDMFSFDRHGNKIVVSHLDGSVVALTRHEAADIAGFIDAENEGENLRRNGLLFDLGGPKDYGKCLEQVVTKSGVKHDFTMKHKLPQAIVQ